MSIKKIHHIAIAVTDIQTSVSFYKKLLECREGLHFFSSNGISEIQYLDGKDYSIELTSRGSQMRTGVKRENESRLKHIAFEVDEIKDFRKKLVSMNLNPSEIKIKKLNSCEISYFFVTDPDGNEVELVSYK